MVEPVLPSTARTLLARTARVQRDGRAPSLVAWRVLRWSPRTALLALIASVPPLCTVWFERWAQRTGRLSVPATAAAVAG